MIIKSSPYKRNGRWYARVAFTDNDGKHHTPSLKAGHSFKTKKAATEYCENHKYEVLSQLPTIKENNVIFTDYFNRWAAIYKLSGARNRTYLRYKSRIPNTLKRYFKDKPIAQITRSDYQAFINWFGLEDRGGHVYDTVSKLHNAVRHCVSLALDESIIRKDFTRGVQLKFNPKKKIEVEYLSFAELQQVKEATIKKLNPLNTGRYMILTAIFTGMRKEEVQALTWSDLDFKNHTIRINKAYNDAKRELEPTTKTKDSTRTIKASPKLFDYLKQLKSNGEDYVFRIPWGNRTIPTSNALSKTIKSILDDCGLQKKNFTFYSFRHVFISILIYKGLDLFPISKYVGNSPQIIQQNYAYELSEMEKATSNKIIGITAEF